MHVNRFMLVAWSALVSVSGSALGEDTHRVLVIDVLTNQGEPNSRMVLLEVESGKILADTEIGAGPEVGLSARGDVVAVLTDNNVGGISRPNARLTTYNTSNLQRLEQGLVPFKDRGGFQDFPPIPTIFFSPDAQEIVVQHMECLMTNEKPNRWPVNNAIFSFLMREVDQDGKFKSARPDARIPCCQVAVLLRVSKWPRIDIWNYTLGAVEVVDIGKGKILSRLALDYEDDKLLRVLDPTALEQPEIGDLYLHLGANGAVVPSRGRYAYYVPRPKRNRKAAPGFVKRIDLDADPPKVVAQGDERQAGLWAQGATASEPGGAIFSPVERKKPALSDAASKEPSNVLRIYNTDNLKLHNEIEVSLPSCDSLEPSHDGKYIYALNRQQAKLAVIDMSSGRQVKVIEKVAKYPALVMALPSVK